MAIVLVHLGESVPPYIKDCVRQLRLWNPMTPIYVILEPCHRLPDPEGPAGEFWIDLKSFYRLNIVYTDHLEPTEHHKIFRSHFKGDTQFRKGYWRHVKERFFYVEELMLQQKLEDCISMEYDIMVYGSLDTLHQKLHTAPYRTLRMVMDNDTRGHPGFLYCPTADAIGEFNQFLLQLLNQPFEDMQSLAIYADMNKSKVHYFPVITERRNRSIQNRKSKDGHHAEDPFFLSEDSEHFGCLFDSLVVGQWLGGIDSRNTGGVKVTNYENEGALYSIKEMPLKWKKNPENFLWQPFLDDRPLMTIHVHSKALKCFLSDRGDYPKDDYDVHEIHKNLLPN